MRRLSLLVRFTLFASTRPKTDIILQTLENRTSYSRPARFPARSTFLSQQQYRASIFPRRISRRCTDLSDLRRIRSCCSTAKLVFAQSRLHNWPTMLVGRRRASIPGAGSTGRSTTDPLRRLRSTRDRSKKGCNGKGVHWEVKLQTLIR